MPTLTEQTEKYERDAYRKRNAMAAAVTSIVRSHCVRNEERASPAAECGVWMRGFTLDCSGLSRKAEKAIIADVVAWLPKLGVQVFRATTLRPRHIDFVL